MARVSEGWADMTLLCRARKVQRPRDSQEVSNLMHFHERPPWTITRTYTQLAFERSSLLGA